MQKRKNPRFTDVDLRLVLLLLMLGGVARMCRYDTERAFKRCCYEQR